MNGSNKYYAVIYDASSLLLKWVECMSPVYNENDFTYFLTLLIVDLILIYTNSLCLPFSVYGALLYIICTYLLYY